MECINQYNTKERPHEIKNSQDLIKNTIFWVGQIDVYNEGCMCKGCRDKILQGIKNGFDEYTQNNQPEC